MNRPPLSSPLERPALAALALFLALSFSVPAAALLLDVLPPVKPAAEKPAANPRRPMIHVGLESATRAASADNALILVVFEVGSSPECREFDKKTLASPLFAENAGPLHVAYFDLESAPKTAAQFQVSTLPDLVLMTAEMKIVARNQGALGPEDLVKWIDRGRRRVARGVWEGISVDDESGESHPPADPEEYKRLVRDLGSPALSDAERAALVLESQGASAMPYLLDGLGDPYLGARIGASEILRKLAPEAPLFDPWDAADARRKQVYILKEWWQATGKLAPVSRPSALSPQEERAAGDALEGVLSQEPVRRTRGMTALVRLGAPVLPRVRDAVRKASEAGDAPTLSVLEDVRWAIIVPDRLEQAVSARRVLARGTSEERQAAALRLGAQQSLALPALRELVDDPDTLVRESTIYALKKVPGDEARDAIALLLKARDTNLRMVAAQTLGSSKSLAAAKYLVSVLSDPDEVVACAAIAALEEVQAKDRYQDLVACLKDKRWRVRAAAAEALGKLQIKAANPALLALLDDDDPFVVKSALTALRSTEGLPDIQRLRSLIKRFPDLTSLAVNCLVQKDNAAVLATISTIYDESDDARRRSVLDGMTESRYYGGSEKDAHWKPFLDKVAASKDPAARLKFVSLLQQRSGPTASPYVSALIADDDIEVRVASARLVIQVASLHLGVAGYTGMPDFDVLKGLAAPPSPQAEAEPAPPVPAPSFKSIVRRVFVGNEQAAKFDKVDNLKHARDVLALHRQWHEALKPVLDQRNDLAVLLAFYITGDGKDGLPLLAAIPERKQLADEIKKLDSEGFAAVVKRLPWPEGESVLQGACKSPVLYCVLVDNYRYSPPEVRAYVENPDRLVPALETFKDERYSRLVQDILGSYDEGLSLYRMTSSNVETLKRLVASTSPSARALGVYVIGSRKANARDDSGRSPGPASAEKPVAPSPEADLDAVQKALADENAWVRYAAAQALVGLLPDQVRREEAVAPLLDDKDPLVATMAAIALLNPRLRSVESLSEYSSFRFDKFRSWSRSYIDERETPVPASIDRKPAFLDVLRRRLAEPPAPQPEVETPRRNAFVLLLAQYGDYSALDKELENWKTSGKKGSSDILLAGLALTKDPKYLEPLKALIDENTETRNLGEILKWLEGVKGQEARDLRRAINRRITSARD